MLQTGGKWEAVCLDNEYRFGLVYVCSSCGGNVPYQGDDEAQVL